MRKRWRKGRAKGGQRAGSTKGSVAETETETQVAKEKKGFQTRIRKTTSQTRRIGRSGEKNSWGNNAEK